MVSSGLATLASCNYDLVSAIHGTKPMHILCIGHGGGSLPLFLARRIQGAVVDIVEIDPLVISASIQAMGFPAFARVEPSGERSVSHPGRLDEVLWKGTHERLFLHESDAEKCVVNTTNIYDLVFIDAYDGDDIFPRKLWDPHGPFLEALRNRLHPKHGTVVVNLHSDDDTTDGCPSTLPMGKYVSQVCQAYKNVLVSDGTDFGLKGAGLGFVVPVPWLCNSSLVVCRGFESGGMSLKRDSVLNALVSKSRQVENVLNLPFSCLRYIKEGITLVY